MYCNTLTVLQLKGLGNAGLYCDIVPSQATIRPGGAQAVGAGAHWARSRRRRGHWGAQGGRRAGVGQARCRRADARGARARERRYDHAGLRHGRGASYDTATVAATRRQCARPCAAWAWPGRWMGVLAGSVGPSWCTEHLAQF